MATRTTERMSDHALSALSRRTSGGAFIPNVDGLRFFCIALVVVFHVAAYHAIRVPAMASSGLVPQVSSVGWIGVQLFFVLSGFILALPFATHRLTGTGQPVNIRRYYLRRLTRLEPPYIVALTLFTLLAIATGDKHYVGVQALSHYGASLVYLHSTIFGDFNATNGALWSLEVEVQFYLLMPALAAVFLLKDSRVRRATLGGGVLAMVVLEKIFIPQGMIAPGRLALSLANNLQYFLIGLLAADVYVSDWRRAPRRTVAWDAVAVVSWVALMTMLIRGVPAPRLLLCPPMLGIILSAFRGRMTSSIMSNRWLFTIGGMCYTIYLIHSGILEALGPTADRVAGGLGLTATLVIESALLGVIVLALSVVFFVLIERPCMDREWPMKLAARVRSGAGQMHLRH